MVTIKNNIFIKDYKFDIKKDKLGEGQYGTVFKAEKFCNRNKQNMPNVIAIKIIKKEKKKEKYSREFYVLKELNNIRNQHIIKLYDIMVNKKM